MKILSINNKPYLPQIIKEEIDNFFNEDVRTFNPQNWNQFREEKPFKEGDKLRVYHGFNDVSDAVLTAKYGITGKERAKRRYSYEMGNNPKGLFVTVDFNKAKEFAGGENAIIMEFNTKYENLEAPVWVGGRSYFVQGEYTQSFSSDEERIDQMLKNRETAKQSENPQVAQSKKPELAHTLFDNPENQALFVGDLNPNEIKFFWIREENNTTFPFKRLTRKEFLKLYDKPEYTEKTIHTSKGYEKKMSGEEIDKKNKAFLPNDDFSMAKIKQHKWWDYSKEQIVAFLKGELEDHNKPLIISMFYPKQLEQIKQNFNLDNNFNKKN